MATIEEFGQKVKAKYPQYSGVDDRELGERFLQKYPQYQEQVTEAPQAQQNPDRTRGVLDAFKKGGSNVIQAFKDAPEQAGEAAERQGVSTAGRIAGTFGKMVKPFATAGAEAVATPLRAAGEVVENVTGKDVNEAVAGKLTEYMQKGMSTQTGQSLMESYEKLKKTNPEAANALGAALDIGEFATMAGGGGAVVSRGAGAAKQAAGGAKTLAQKVAEKPAPEARLNKSLERIKSNLREQIEGKVSTTKKLDKKRSDVLTTIASDTRYHPQIDVDNKSFDVKDAVTNMSDDIAQYSDDVSALFSALDKTDGGIPVADLMSGAKNHLLRKENVPKLVVGNKNMLKEFEQMFENIQQVFGDNVPREQVWEIRKQIDNNINSLSDTNVRKALRQDVRKSFAKALEGSVIGDQSELVKRAMGEVGKLLDARDYLDDALKGSKVQGGRLTDIIRDSTASQVGAMSAGVGGGLIGGIGGAAAGYMVSQQIGKWLAKNTLSSAADRKTLKNFVKEKPEVFQEIRDYINDLPKKEAEKARKNLKQIKALPESKDK
jgi:gas vesicle protein/nucleoside diphosphate kinase